MFSVYQCGLGREPMVVVGMVIPAVALYMGVLPQRDRTSTGHAAARPLGAPSTPPGASKKGGGGAAPSRGALPRRPKAMGRKGVNFALGPSIQSEDPIQP